RRRQTLGILCQETDSKGLSNRPRILWVLERVRSESGLLLSLESSRNGLLRRRGVRAAARGRQPLDSGAAGRRPSFYHRAASAGSDATRSERAAGGLGSEPISGAFFPGRSPQAVSRSVSAGGGGL